MIVCSEVEKKIDSTFSVGPLTLTVEPGIVTALVGSNGSGKSSLLRLISGLIQPDQGSISRFQREETNWREKIAFIPQSSKGFEKYTLGHLAAIHQVGFKNWDQKKFESLLKRYDLPVDKDVEELSGGMQRQALAVLALSRSSTMLIMDEPLAGVDVHAQERLQQDWLTYLEEDPNRSIVFATHVPDEIKDLADQIICMNAGHLVGKYEKDELLARYARFWTNESIEQVRNLEGIHSVIERGPQVEILSEDREKTELALLEKQLNVTLIQPIKMAEILRMLLKEGEEINDAHY
ncbi:ABC transporter, ATP-binding protein [Bacillus sp. JCM 19045]|nr:ABC transporter, ATP-binding protein [Bacillus sp. JCM 19045]